MTSDDQHQTPHAAVRHVPVLGREAIDALNVKRGGIYIDGTFGAGGYTREILARGGDVIALDRDVSAIKRGMPLADEFASRLTLLERQFSTLDEAVDEPVDGVVLDIGVSSMQLDEAGRGFSFRADGPLDMRMGAQGFSAADVVATASERELADIIFRLGEERHSRAVARAIIREREISSIETTTRLADIVGRVVRHKPHEIHPATRTFQALRIFVNDELRELADALAAAERALKPGGRLVVVSFHSLEDRIVKSFLVERGRAAGGSRHQPEIDQPDPTFNVLTKRPVIAGDEEVERNPRARSAKLRAAERTAAPPRGDALHLLPETPALDAIGRGR